MTVGGAARGTVVRWDDARNGGVAEVPGLAGGCWVPATAVHGGSGPPLRAGQIVDLEWTEPGAEGLPVRATRAVPREDLQATVGG